MPKHNLNDIAKKQEELSEKINRAAVIAVLALGIGTTALVVSLSGLGVL